MGLCCLTACGYHFSDKNADIALSVPFVKGDRSGVLTTALIEELSRSHRVTYGGVDAPYVLKVEIIAQSKEEVGYQYQTQGVEGIIPQKQSEKRLSPVESTQTLKVRVTALSKNSKEILFGPFEMEESLEYDYADNKSFSDLAFVTPGGKTVTYLDLSLGQLDAEEDATGIARIRLYQELAKKIVKAANFASMQ